MGAENASSTLSEAAASCDEWIELSLRRELLQSTSDVSPRVIRDAMWAAVIPGGARIRPKLCLRIFNACGGAYLAVTESAAAAIEMLHCASLVHDDLPCFDNALYRRQKPSLHRSFGEAAALLAGDALIVVAFRVISKNITSAPEVTARIIEVIVNSIGPAQGLIAGQAMELSNDSTVERYHDSKTVPLFVASAVCGAIGGGADPTPWTEIGEMFGRAYQIADDISDAAADEVRILEKRNARGIHKDCPITSNIVLSLGLEAAVNRFKQCVTDIQEAIPLCPGRDSLRRWTRQTLREIAKQAGDTNLFSGLA